MGGSLQFPYGIADFRAIRRDGMVYVDRTAYVREVERLGRTLVFLRPRRFGKSLWLQTLATYYDLRYAAAFDTIFGGLAVHREPTPLQGRYFVLQWNFSRVQSFGSVREIAADLEGHVRSRAEIFLEEYKDYCPAVRIGTHAGASQVLDALLGAVRRAGRPLYLLIDEYDNFINEVMVRDAATYKALLETDGPFKGLMKAVKNATEGLGLERVFVTGVSPVALNDLTSGFNIATDVSLRPELAGLCGFREEEIRGLLEAVAREGKLSSQEQETALETMRTWYNGYRFTNFPARHLPADFEKGVYNPVNVLYFLKYLDDFGEPPATLQDENLRTHQGKLGFLAQTAAGTGVIEELAEGSGEIRIPRLLERFSLDDMVWIRKDRSSIASFLYYMGLLTLTEAPGHLRLPNLVVRKLFLDRLLEVSLPDRAESYEAREVALSFFDDGDLGPLLAFFEEKLLPALSNRDQGAPPQKPGQSGSGVNEMTLKALFLAILFDDRRFVLHSELEVEKGHVDLCLLVRPENPYPNPFHVLFELKLVRRKTVGKKGAELRSMEKAALRELPSVKAALGQARKQVERYRDGLVRTWGDEVPVRCYAVVTVGLDRLVGDEVIADA